MAGWKLTWGGRSWTDEDVTAAHLVAVSNEAPGLKWDATSPWSHPQALAAWLIVLVASDRRVSLADAMAEVYSRPASELLASLAERE